MRKFAQIVAWFLGQRFVAYCEKTAHAQKHAIRVSAEVNEKMYDFYRCQACHRLITKLEEFEFFDPTSPHYGEVCACGFRRFSPTNMEWWEWALPRVWKFALIRALGVA